MRLLRQPLIIGYILTGILVGPAALGLIHSEDAVEVLGKFGIVLLLFIVGLGLNPRFIRELGKVAFIAGVGQMLFSTTAGFFLIRAMGFDATTALYLSVALAFSSTIIILKLFTDKKEQNKLHGRIAIGFLLVQDLFATVALVLATAAGNGQGMETGQLLELLGKGAAVGLGLLVLTFFVVRRATNFLASSQETLFIFSVAWGFGAAALFYKIGLSLEVGALFGGVALASMPYAADVSAKLRPLRDFFIVAFFIALGAGLELTHIGGQWGSAILLSLFVLVGKPLVVMVIMGMLGYTKKVSFKVALAVAQISEFSLILLLIGVQNGQLSDDAMALATLVALITFALSSYLIIYSDKLYDWTERYLTLFERRKVKYEQEHGEQFEAVLLGYRKGGHEFARLLRRMKKKYVVIDYDPEVINELERTGKDYLYGDAMDADLLEEAGVEHAKIIIITITNEETVEFVLTKLQALNPDAAVICVADTLEAAARFYSLGASYVMVLHSLSSKYLSDILSKGLTPSELKRRREKHFEYIRTHSTGELPHEEQK